MSVQAGAWPVYDNEGEAAGQHSVPATERAAEFAGLVERHSRLMFRVASGLLRNAHDAEDAVQEALLKLYRGEAWRAMEDEKAFLARTVWRVGLDRIAARRPKRMEDVTGMELTAAGETPEGQAVEAQERALLRLLIDRLPGELREVLVLSAIEEMSSCEVGAVLEIPEGTVRTRVMRAKAELKRRYEAMQEVRR